MIFTGRSFGLTDATGNSYGFPRVTVYGPDGKIKFPTGGGPPGGGTVVSVGFSAGTGISLAGTNPITVSGIITITNSAPDLVVSLTTIGTGLSVTGTYPNFTLENTAPGVIYDSDQGVYKDTSLTTDTFMLGAPIGSGSLIKFLVDREIDLDDKKFFINGAEPAYGTDGMVNIVGNGSGLGGFMLNISTLTGVGALINTPIGYGYEIYQGFSSYIENISDTEEEVLRLSRTTISTSPGYDKKTSLSLLLPNSANGSSTPLFGGHLVGGYEPDIPAVLHGTYVGLDAYNLFGTRNRVATFYGEGYINFQAYGSGAYYDPPSAVYALGVDNGGNILEIDVGGGGGGIPFATASGTDTYTATVTGVTGYTDGDAYIIRFTNGNTDQSTLNINGIGAKILYKNNDGPLIGGDIWDGGEMICIYNSVLDGFDCIGSSPNTLFAYVTNAETSTITRGQAVYAFGGTGNRMTVKLARANTDATSAQTVGFVFSTSIAANQKGIIIIQGYFTGLSLFHPVNGWLDGDPVYLSPTTPGAVTRTKPYAPNHLVYLGVVATASPGAAGRMYVRVQNGYELDELHNVQAQSPSLNDTLWYDSSVSPGQWKTASIPTILGYTPVPTTRTISTTSPLTGGGDLSADRTLSIPAATGSVNGYLTSTDWTNFNTAYTNRITSLTTTGSSGAATLSSNTLNIPNYTLSGLGGVPTSRTLTINGTALDLSADRSWTVGSVTSVSGTGTAFGLTLTGTVTTSGNLTLGGTLAVPISNITATGTPSATTYLRGDGTWATIATGGTSATIGTTIDGSGGTITVGQKGYVQVPYACTINSWRIIANASGSIVIDIWKAASPTIPTVANTITGSAKPTLSSQQTAASSTLTGWTTSVAANDIIGFNVDSATTVTWVILQIFVTKI